MKTIVIDGQEYVLVPKEQLQPVETPQTVNNARETAQEAFHGGSSLLDDFTDTTTVSKPVDDGLATAKEKDEAIRVVEPVATQNVRQAVPRPYAYRQKFIKKELTPADVLARPTYHGELLKGNPEDPMIKADAQKPKEMQLFYGPGTQYEGY